MSARLTLEEYVEGVLSGDRVVLGRAITLVESKLPSDMKMARQLMEKIIPHSGNSIRIGITGVPGVGKSTFIETLGKHLIAQGKKVAVLAIDPSSQLSKGSILGDKTRMEELSKDSNAFIRPTPSKEELGGVAAKTREGIFLCEAAGFDVIIVETVGVGQSETRIKHMTDFFLLLMLAGAGDELQGIKKGIMEMADALIINKADGDNVDKAKRAKVEYENAMHLFPLNSNGWTPKVSTCSALENEGIAEVWSMILEYKEEIGEHFNADRQEQNVHWFHWILKDELGHRIYTNAEAKKEIETLETQVRKGKLSAYAAAYELMSKY